MLQFPVGADAWEVSTHALDMIAARARNGDRCDANMIVPATGLPPAHIKIEGGNAT
jgi:hypothetical protein